MDCTALSLTQDQARDFALRMLLSTVGASKNRKPCHGRPPTHPYSCKSSAGMNRRIKTMPVWNVYACMVWYRCGWKNVVRCMAELMGGGAGWRDEHQADHTPAVTACTLYRAYSRNARSQHCRAQRRRQGGRPARGRSQKAEQISNITRKKRGKPQAELKSLHRDFRGNVRR